MKTKPDEDKEEGFEDATEDTAEVDKDMVKQDKTLFNREDVPEARTGSTRKSNSQHPKNWRLKELMLMLLLLQVGKHNEVAEVMKKNNSREIIDAVMLNTEYEADIQVHRGREINMSEDPETRDGMLNPNPKGKHDKNVKFQNSN